jgi:hypothetical protein
MMKLIFMRILPPAAIRLKKPRIRRIPTPVLPRAAKEHKASPIALEAVRNY